MGIKKTLNAESGRYQFTVQTRRVDRKTEWVKRMRGLEHKNDVSVEMLSP
jgi:hypothetical protein